MDSIGFKIWSTRDSIKFSTHNTRFNKVFSTDHKRFDRVFDTSHKRLDEVLDTDYNEIRCSQILVTSHYSSQYNDRLSAQTPEGAKPWLV